MSPDTTQKITKALGSIVEVLSATHEARDAYTAGHQNRTATIADAIAENMSLDDEVRQGLGLAARIHDIGKITVPYAILNKPTRLSDAEFELIKAHPVVGADLLANVKFDWPVASIIRQHHERTDGTGYPDGLAGEEILIEARILAVADTLEAMASHRPYRPALGLDAALQEIKSGSGSRYDAMVAKTCLSLANTGELEDLVEF